MTVWWWIPWKQWSRPRYINAPAQDIHHTSLIIWYELIIPKATPLAQLELFQKRMIQQILSLLTRTADPAVYILSGLLPVEAQIHIRALGLFNNICNQAEDSVEKTLAKRQLIVKSNESNSWYIEIKKTY